jgi:hypothetical protein
MKDFIQYIANWNWDVISGLTQIITVIYLFYQFHYLPKQERKAGIENLRVLWGLSKQRLDTLIYDLTEYCVENESENKLFIDKVTFQSQLAQLHYLKIADLNDKIFENMIKLCTSKDLIVTATQNLNDQIRSFTLLQAHFNTTFKFKER